MKKPTHQKFIENAGWVFCAILAVGGLLDSISNAINLINIKVAIIATVLITIGFSILNIIIKERKINWVSNDGKEFVITKIGKKITWSISGVVLLIWLPIVLNTFTLNKKNSAPKQPKSKEPENAKPVFEKKSKSYNVLVLPFYKECEFNGISYDIGAVICKRLRTLNQLDSLNISVEFLDDSIQLKSIGYKYAEKIMQYHNADLIIYGTYSLKECEGDGHNKICFNYVSNIAKDVIIKSSNVEYDMKSFSGINDLRKGKGQEEIDGIIYQITAWSYFHHNKFVSAIQTLKKVPDYESNFDVLETISLIYSAAQEVDSAFKILLRLYKCMSSS
ncbi:MAG: hypothetical protein JNK00_13000 [Flavipsychrobacter sp.]|nr:hypothetical protein [Flavipsychrobacter sp.]